MDGGSTGSHRQDQSQVANNLSSRSARNRWQQAFDASPDMISILDKDHRIITINKAMADTLNCTAEDAVGMHCFQLVHQTEQPPLACPHTCLLEDGKPHRADIYEQVLNMWLAVDVTPLYDDDGALIGSIHIARDITHQKQVEQALRESQEQYRHLSEAAMEGILLSRQTEILLANQALADMFGQGVDNLTGRNLLDFITPPDRERLREYLGIGLKNSDPECINHEFTCIRKDGSAFPIAACTRRVTFNGETINQTTIRDLTHQKQNEQARADRQRLQGVLEMAGTVCHELNQPLTAIYGHMDLLTAQLPDNNCYTSDIEIINNQLKRIESTTRKLMHITRYKTKPYPGGEQIIDLDQAVSENVFPKSRRKA